VPGYTVFHSAGTVAPLASAGPVGYTPSQVRHAYGFDQVAHGDLEAVKKAIDELNNGGLPPGVRIETIYDRSNLVNTTLETVAHSVGMGIGLVVVVLLFFLGSPRLAGLVGAPIDAHGMAVISNPIGTLATGTVEPIGAIGSDFHGPTIISGPEAAAVWGAAGGTADVTASQKARCGAAWALARTW